MTKCRKYKGTQMMFYRKFLYAGFCCLFPFYHSIIAQSAVTASGGDGTGAGGSVAYSIGQVTYTNVAGEDGTIQYGVQQPNLFLTVGTQEADIHLSAVLFPNPVSTSAFLKLEDQEASLWSDDLTYRVYDLTGKLLMEESIQAEITNIPVDQLIGSVFVLQVNRKDKEIKSFKMLKTN